MKKLLLLVFSVYSLSIIGQQQITSRLSIGLFTGVSLSNYYSIHTQEKYFINTGEHYIRLDSDGYFSYLKPSDYYNYSNDFFPKTKFGLNMGISLKYELKKKYFLISGLAIEEKGINHTESASKSETKTTGETGTTTYTVNTLDKLLNRISSEYLILPLRIRKEYESGYLWEVGGYLGFLMSSYRSIKIEHERRIADVSGFYSRDQYYRLGNITHTAKIDFGVTLSNGFKLRIRDGVSFVCIGILNVGLNRLDGKYTNEYIHIQEDRFGYTPLVKKNNYYGYNSYSKNINFLLNVGLEFDLQGRDGKKL